MSSPSSRIAQSKLANAVKNGDSDSTIKALRIKFAAARAIDAIHAIPGHLDHEDHATLLLSVNEKAPSSAIGGRHG
ncbi:hypothetical protein ACMZ29_17215 [Brevibacterium casei]|uniref:hypothetical protein n=1 Tax=Brevibacterium casei TaxID=33889 RepID=UPI0039EF5913